MKCRENCGACCIAPSISSLNKPAGVRCIHLDDEMRCRVFLKPERPAACANFMPEPDICGTDREQALTILTWLEASTQ